MADHVAVLRQMLTTGDVSDWRALDAALEVAIAALSAPEASGADYVAHPLATTPRTTGAARMTPTAALAPSVALERLEDEWRERAKQYYGTRTIGRDVLTNCADELATLRASLAQRGEAVAWIVRQRCDDVFTVESAAVSYAAAIGGQLIPLFTHPAAGDKVQERDVDILAARGVFSGWRPSQEPAPADESGAGEECKHERSHGAPWRCAKCGYRFDDAARRARGEG